MIADLRFEQMNDVTVASLSGDVDMSNADDIATGLLRGIGNDMLMLVLDLSSVDYFDSAGIHLAYDLRERLRVRGQRLRLVVPAASPVRDALELAAVIDVMDVAQTLDEALAGPAAPD